MGLGMDWHYENWNSMLVSQHRFTFYRKWAVYGATLPTRSSTSLLVLEAAAFRFGGQQKSVMFRRPSKSNLP